MEETLKEREAEYARQIKEPERQAAEKQVSQHMEDELAAEKQRAAKAKRKFLI